MTRTFFGVESPCCEPRARFPESSGLQCSQAVVCFLFGMRMLGTWTPGFIVGTWLVAVAFKLPSLEALRLWILEGFKRGWPIRTVGDVQETLRGCLLALFEDVNVLGFYKLP